MRKFRLSRALTISLAPFKRANSLWEITERVQTTCLQSLSKASRKAGRQRANESKTHALISEEDRVASSSRGNSSESISGLRLPQPRKNIPCTPCLAQFLQNPARTRPQFFQWS